MSFASSISLRFPWIPGRGIWRASKKEASFPSFARAYDSNSNSDTGVVMIPFIDLSSPFLILIAALGTVEGGRVTYKVLVPIGGTMYLVGDCGAGEPRIPTTTNLSSSSLIGRPCVL